MTDQASFWRGISAGFIAGIAVAAVLRFTSFEKTTAVSPPISDTAFDEDPHFNLETMQGQPVAASTGESEADEWPEKDHPRSNVLIMSGRADDLKLFSAAGTVAVTSFLRSSSGQDAELTEVLGRVARMDHIDLTQPLRTYAHDVEMGSPS